ncbi:MAG: hypothetical protein Kow0029_30100 [Candidatus Rifleibacteriota bacterium]
MKNYGFTIILALIFLLVLAACIFYYYDQRTLQIEDSHQLIQNQTHFAGQKISQVFLDLMSEFNKTSAAGHFDKIFLDESTSSKKALEPVQNFYTRFDQIIRRIFIFDSAPKTRVITKKPGDSYILSTEQTLPQTVPQTEGIHYLNGNIFVVRLSKINNLKICLELSLPGMLQNLKKTRLENNIYAETLLPQSALLRTVHLTQKDFYHRGMPEFRITISDELKNAFSKRFAGIKDVSMLQGDVEIPIILAYSPVSFANESLYLIRVFQRNYILKSVNATFWLFFSVFCLIFLFFILSLVLKHTLDKQTIISKELAEQKDLFYLLISSMPIGIAVKDVTNDLRYLVCNHSAARIFNRNVSEIIGKTDKEIFPENIALEQEKEDAEVILKGKTEAKDKVLQNYGDGGIWIRSVRLPIYDSSGKIYLILRIVEDITDRVKLENQLQQSQRMEEVGKLAGGIAHEFNNLLQVIIGYCDFIRNDESDDRTNLETNLQQIESASNTAMNLTRKLLTYSRKSEPKMQICDLNQVVADTIKMLKRIMDKSINFSLQTYGHELKVNVDPGQIEQVLINLCINASDAMQGSGRLSLSIDVVKEVPEAIEMGIRRNIGQLFALIRVADTGPGIPDHLKKSIFEPFFTTKEVGKGTGLGLSIVYAIMKQHGGYVFIAENNKPGAEFLLYLPLTDLSDGFNTSSDTKGLSSKTVFTNAVTILLAEDEESVRSMIKKLLLKHGFKIIEAQDGEEAVTKFKEFSDEIDLLLFDVMMPQKTGKAAYDEIVTIKPEIPTLFCTGFSDELITQQLLDRGPVKLIHKPYKNNELIDAIFELLSKK